MFGRFRPKIRVCGKCSHGYSFEVRDYCPIPKRCGMNRATKLLSRIFEILKILENFEKKSTFFKNFENFPRNFQNFQKTVTYVKWQYLKMLCRKFQVASFEIGVIIAFYMPKTGIFGAILYVSCNFPIFNF